MPCHRVVKSNMEIGDYRGGSKMKKEILENEGVRLIGYRVI
ncbi:MAG: MGMT family protein [Methanobacterium sp.]